MTTTATTARTAPGSSSARRTRSARRTHFSITNPRKNVMLTAVTGLFGLYCLLPLVWLVINATKTQGDFVSTFGLSFGKSFALFDNIREVFTYNDGIFGRWVLNTLLYVIVGATVSTFLAALGGYALAKLEFTGKRVFLFVVLGSISVPGIALAIPQFMLFAQLGITNTPWAVLMPVVRQPVRPLPHVGVRHRRRPDRLARSRADGRGGRVPHVLAHRAPDARPGERHGAAVLVRVDLEQLLPALDHAQGPHLVPADHRHQPVEQAWRRRPATPRCCRTS